MNEDAAAPVAPDEPAPTSGGQPRVPCPIVGIGASAGGLDALQRLLPAVDPECGMAFVLVQHLSPDHGSILTDILSRFSRLPVAQIADATEIAPNRVYVIPPDAGLTIREGLLRLGPPSGPRGHRNPIDDFLVSLAREAAENAACVILSGTGSDGTLGLRAIKENGGLTLAQAEAEYDGMMRSAVATGLVDFVLKAEDIPAKLSGYFCHLTAVGDRKGPDGILPDSAESLGPIYALLRARTRHDFSGYKNRTFLRRVQRRMDVLGIGRASDFVERLREEPHEVDLLFQDLLIGVTSFFRDPAAFEALEREVVPNLFEGKRPNDAVRVWVPGCATGEEAYSIAMLLRDRAARIRGAPALQVFASDIDERALEIARTGRYPATSVGHLPPGMLARHFVREDGTYRIAAELRGICLFSSHNLLRDAPFSRLDLVSCRNLLIYLTSELQNRVVPLLHYALRPGGYLFLGGSENVTRHGRLFATVDKAHRVFRRHDGANRAVPEFPLTAPQGQTPRKSAADFRAPSPEGSLKAAAERQILDRYAPVHVVVTAEGDVLQSSGRTGKYLELPVGQPDINVFRMARAGLRPDLRAALHRAASSGRVAAQSNVAVETDGGQQRIDMFVQPLRYAGTPDALYLVVFRELGGIEVRPELGPVETEDDVEASNLRQLEGELRVARERLQTTTEELESSNEELTSSNEELSSMNEELQSTNEELETSREELQSINEELMTVNAELNVRVEELSRANSDMTNLLDSTQIATVFLDRDLAVKSFTPAARDVFRLVESDTGRPIAHVQARVRLDSLRQDAERVLRTLATVERQVASAEDDTRYVMRMAPYRGADNVIGGVVLTFTDITRITEAEARIQELTRDLRNRAENLETLLDLVPVGVFIAEDAAASKVLVNQYAARLIGEGGRRKGLRPVAVTRFRLFRDGRETAPEDQPLQRAARTGEAVEVREERLEVPGGGTAYVMGSATPLFDEQGASRGAIAAMVDISQSRAEARTQVLLHELQHRVKNILATVGSLATRTSRGSASLAEFRAAFLARLAAMGRMHDLLSGRAWEGADLRSVIAASLEAYANEDHANVVLDGAEILVNPAAAATLGMVFHELATNAAKYGALSVARGRVEVSWRVDGNGDAGKVRVVWRERNGPAAAPSPAQGFGTSFVRRSVEYEMQGNAEMEFGPDGLRCIITFPLRPASPTETTL